jgi:hypothetical protein
LLFIRQIRASPEKLCPEQRPQNQRAPRSAKGKRSRSKDQDGEDVGDALQNRVKKGSPKKPAETTGSPSQSPSILQLLGESVKITFETPFLKELPKVNLR